MLIEGRTMDSFDPASMDSAVRGTSLDHTLLGRGRFLGHLLTVQLNGQRLNHGRYNLPLHARGSMPADSVTLGFILGGTGASTLNAEVVEYPMPALLGAAAELDYRLAPGSEWLSLQVPPAALEPLGLVPEHFAGHRLAPRSARTDRVKANLQQAVIALGELARDDPNIVAPHNYAEKVLAGVFDDLITVLQPERKLMLRHPSGPQDNKRLVRRAINHMQAHYGGTLQIGLMAATLGTSVKTLERAFLKVHGIRPKHYLSALRLTKARRQLLCSPRTGQSVAVIATSCGIQHLGRFAQLYRATYGELPSETVKARHRG